MTAAHDLSEGGLSQAVFEMLQASGKGADLNLAAVHEDAFTALFSESASRVLVAVTADRADALVERAGAAGVSAAVIGSTRADGELHFGGEQLSIAQLRDAWADTLPSHFAAAHAPNAAV